MLWGDGKYLFMEDPIDDICARWVSEGALIVEELALIVLWAALRYINGLKELIEVDLLNWPKVQGSELLYEGMTLCVQLKYEPNHCESLFVLVEGLWRSIDQLMHDVNFQIVMLVIKSVLCRSMHVHMIHLVDVGTLAVEVSQLNVSKIIGLKL